MNCTDVKEQLDDYLDGVLDSGTRAHFMAHIADCELCRNNLNHAQHVLHTLQRLPVEPVSNGFAEKAIKRAAELHTKAATRRHRHWFAAGFGGTLAAGVLLALFAGPFNLLLSDNAPVNQISMNVNESRTLNVVFNVPKAMQDVELELELTEGLQLVSHPQQRVLSWQTSLKQGNNRLPLSVKATRAGDAAVIARIRKDGKQKEFRIQLNVESGSLSLSGHEPNWI